ncbi:MAG: sulfatase-like hydrolase/transferase, partial [Chloroflexota bacterium]
MNSVSGEKPIGEQDSREGSERSVTRRRFLKRTVTVGAVSLAALFGAAGCGEKARPVSEQAFIARTPLATRPAQPTAAPPPNPDPSAVAEAATAVRPTAVADPSPAPTPGATLASIVTSPPRQPNVLLVTIDTLRSDRLGAYGFGQAHTPVLDQMARDGVRFDRAICQLPQTNASHATIMT